MGEEEVGGVGAEREDGRLVWRGGYLVVVRVRQEVRRRGVAGCVCGKGRSRGDMLIFQRTLTVGTHHKTWMKGQLPCEVARKNERS